MGNKYVQNRELKNAECLTYMLPYLLRDAGYYGKNPDVSPTLDPFTMTMIKDAPRQDNGGDCGVYALKFIEYMSSEENPSFANPSGTSTATSPSVSTVAKLDP
nr:uncharacterized protein LOC125422576 [Ziziphus jujuba var. spinosa]